jgi:hypothetical protein
MIPWWSVLVNTLWILGLALLLADLSFFSWLARQEGSSLRRQFNRAQFLKFFWLGLLLFALGLAGTSDRLWEVALWFLLALLCLVRLWPFRSLN